MTLPPPADPVTALIKLRAQMVRMSHEVDSATDLIPKTRRGAYGELGRRMRDAVMTWEMVDACSRVDSAKFNEIAMDAEK